MDLPSRTFYEGVNPKKIWNNCHKSTIRHIRRILMSHTSRQPHPERATKGPGRQGGNLMGKQGVKQG